MASILVVDGDDSVASELSQELRREGHNVRTASDATGGLRSLRDHPPDLVILDPGLDETAFEVCRRMRRETTVPIIILTERSDELDKVVGLELGADDYVTKPFSKKELLARVRVRLRRSERSLLPPPADVTVGDFHADLLAREFWSGNKLIALPPKEFELLTFLMHNAGRIFTREQLLRQLWSYEAVGRTRTVDVHINRLRAKIERDPSHPRWLITVRGLGYRFRA